ncbi:hypothetical protein FGG08_002439 [Glutinoglossum americanum]|uniref:BBC1/AIM3 cysteine proteinase-fold domain-containing protein n=1 Tax=Glutinoglossum americanum TaxID=1670608 RepID=A0A9P8KZ79_9PEZI|nr:hypothetical protein FGG08_002439 [Glutinoglossum americanum]
MSGLKDVVKGGWHPKGKDGKKESWREEHKGINQVAGWVGMGKDSTSRSDGHVSRPLSTLKDPSTFGPPPRRVAASDGITPTSTGGSGRPRIQTEQKAEEGAEGNRPAPDLPPKPPARRHPNDSEGSANTPSEPPKPNLPPRLPPRQNSHPATGVTSSPTAYNTTSRNPIKDNASLNQGALNRLGQAGVSVPGFNIGSRRIPPQEASGSPIRSPSPTTPSRKNPQLNVLQSKFSNLSTSSPKANPPSEGTTFAQKQAALRTAESFRKDPSSVSLADARSAASTANNFRERHGEQVSRGWKAADSLNKKYAVVDRVNSYAGNEPSSVAPGLPPNKPNSHAGSPPSPAVPDITMTSGKKKPPPPPPPKKRALGGGGDQSGAPPPLPLTSKPKPGYTASQPNDQDRPVQITFKGANDTPGDVELSLDSLWFAKNPPAFPPPAIARIEEKLYVLSSSWSRSGPRTTHTLTAIVRWTSNLSTTKIRLTWDASNPRITVKAEQKHFPPPSPLSPRELEAQQQRYGDRIAGWCEARIGTQVGNGECWTLAHDALEAVAKECNARGEEPPMVSSGTTHGCCIYAHFIPSAPSPPDGLEAAGVARGDILQFKSSHFVSKDPNNVLKRSESWAGARKGTLGVPDHTAVVVGVRGPLLTVLEQNTGGVKRVVEGAYRLDEMVDGEVRVFRPVGESWCPLDTSW